MEGGRLAQVSHQHENGEERYGNGQRIEHGGESIIKAVENGWNSNGQHVERTTVARIEAGEGDEIAAYAAEDGVQEG